MSERFWNDGREGEASLQVKASRISDPFCRSVAVHRNPRGQAGPRYLDGTEGENQASYAGLASFDVEYAGFRSTIVRILRVIHVAPCRILDGGVSPESQRPRIIRNRYDSAEGVSHANLVV
jgi:hypothetical protein